MAQANYKWHGKSFLKHIATKEDKLLQLWAKYAKDKAIELVPVDTGALQKSIYTKISKKEKSATLGATQFYASFVELGTNKMPAQPYLRPAMISAATKIGLLKKIS